MKTMIVDLQAAVPLAEDGLYAGEVELLAQASPAIVAQTLRWAAERLQLEAAEAYKHEDSPFGTPYYTRSAAVLSRAAEAIERDGVVA